MIITALPLKFSSYNYKHQWDQQSNPKTDISGLSKSSSFISSIL
ncbi:hypothetical protein BACPLE_02672 [Phocaeicola plebeius DSM 17135]|uniref:Uncharacterized protein n=1 Tax=Phocaeicola plebeius (strain DSM 17135 / JCM 12973 / CCUG 54634 / M2) TaxID=484018 RepID=B5D0Z5_PHOPM|nr:hypothetical protein BACPLE_02672 [Phocaeicola plebeius DSM 17135]